MRFLRVLLFTPWLIACPSGDVGAPCNHGSIEPPETDVVTFPALSCNDLMCVYADREFAPEGECSTDAECNEADPESDRFLCIAEDSGAGQCQLSMDYVLDRSMCSRTCESDADCRDGGPFDQVLADDTSCDGGFACARIQALGDFCCEQVCVCRDDLGINEQLEQRCASGTQPLCCVDDTGTPVTPQPRGCGT